MLLVRLAVAMVLAHILPAAAQVKIPSPFSYDSPTEWQNVYPDCGGDLQSPIGLDSDYASNPGTCKGCIAEAANYHPLKPSSSFSVMLADNTKNMQVTDSYGTFTLAGDQYTARQFHFHFPSEHSLDGEHLAAEMHLVHTDSNGKFVVLGFLFEEGEANTFLESLDWATSLLPGPGKEIFLNTTVDIKSHFAEQMAGDFYRYDGSLTTPPCTEGVHWFVATKLATVSTAQIEAFKKIFPNPMNNRPIQPRNGRTLAFNSLSVAHVENAYLDTATTAEALAAIFFLLALLICWIQCCK